MKTVREIVTASALGLVLLQGSAQAQEVAADQSEAGVWSAMTEAGQRSSDLRARIVFSLRVDEDANGANRWSEAIPIETLVDQARGSTDPVVLSLMVDRCSDDLRKAGRCDAVDLVRRWTVADTQNQLAWVALSTVLGREGDLDAARAAFRRAAQAPQWHEYSPEIARSIEPLVPKATGSQIRAALLLEVAIKSWAALPSDHFQTINQRCKEPELKDACGRILEVTTRDAQSMMTLNMATRIAMARALPSASAAAAMQTRLDAMWWAAAAHSRLLAAATPADAQRQVAYLEQLIARNEIEMLRATLLEARLDENAAARKFVATLGAEQLAYRNLRVPNTTPTTR